MRETYEYTTSGGHKIVFYSYATFGDTREITKVFLDEVSVGVEGDQKTMGAISGSKVFESQNKAIQLLVVSVDGEKENILDKINSLRPEDGQEVLEQLDKIQQGIGKKKG